MLKTANDVAEAEWRGLLSGPGKPAPGRRMVKLAVTSLARALEACIKTVSLTLAGAITTALTEVLTLSADALALITAIVVISANSRAAHLKNR